MVSLSLSLAQGRTHWCTQTAPVLPEHPASHWFGPSSANRPGLLIPLWSAWHSGPRHQATATLPVCQALNPFIQNTDSPVNLASEQIAIIIKCQRVLHILPRYCFTVWRGKLVLKLKQIVNYFCCNVSIKMPEFIACDRVHFRQMQFKGDRVCLAEEAFRAEHSALA